MRLLFFCDWEFTELCQALAVQLGKDHKDMGFSCVVAGKKAFQMLKNQNEVPYAHLYYAYGPFRDFEEEQPDYGKLEDYEKEYGDPTLWNMLYSDRELVVFAKKEHTHAQLLKILQRYIRETENILDEAKPDYVVMPTVASLPTRVLFAIAKKKGIKTLFFTSTRTDNRTHISYDPFVGFNKILSDFEEFKSGKKVPEHMEEAKKIVFQFRKSFSQPDYMAAGREHSEKNLSPISLLKRFPRVVDYLIQDFSSNPEIETFERTTLIEKLQELAVKHKRRFEFDSKLFEKPVLGEKYVLFPLHLDPEMATMVRAPMYINQLATVENIAKSLPVTYKLYVKEHPMMAFFGKPRTSHFYQALKKIPNLRLISPYVDTGSLISNSKLVVVITGTVGWEAAILKKPVITLGKVFYNCLDSVSLCQDISSLPDLVFRALRDYAHDEEGLLMLLSAICSNSFKGDYMYLSGVTGAKSPQILKHQDFTKLYDLFCRELDLSTPNHRV